MRHFGPHYVHQVTNTGAEPAISVHVYTPGLAWMNTYRIDGVVARPHRHRAGGGGLVSAPTLTRPSGARTIDDLLAEARGPHRAGDPARGRRPHRRRRVPGRHPPRRPAAPARARCPASLIVERNVLEWRFDPASDARLPEATGYDVDVIVLCSEGYTSSLAADALRSLGLHRATDVIGGFLAWAAAGLPTTGTP